MAHDLTDLSEIMTWRYSVKDYDTNKKLSAADFQSLKDVLRLSPSATNIQPWHYVIADDNAGKERIAKATDGHHEANSHKIRDASHVIVFCSLAQADDEYLQKVLEQEDADGRFTEPKHKDQMDAKRKKSVNKHRYATKDEAHWLAQQVHITMGSLLLAAAMLGIDATPMEGVDFAVLDEELDLNTKGFSSIGVVSLGYRSGDGYNATLPKSRLSEADIMSKA